MTCPWHPQLTCNNNHLQQSTIRIALVIAPVSKSKKNTSTPSDPALSLPTSAPSPTFHQPPGSPQKETREKTPCVPDTDRNTFFLPPTVKPDAFPPTGRAGNAQTHRPQCRKRSPRVRPAERPGFPESIPPAVPPLRLDRAHETHVYRRRVGGGTAREVDGGRPKGADPETFWLATVNNISHIR